MLAEDVPETFCMSRMFGVALARDSNSIFRIVYMYVQAYTAFCWQRRRWAEVLVLVIIIKRLSVQ